MWWSERGCPIKATRCRVLAPTMPLRLRRDTPCGFLRGISIGFHPMGLELCDGLTPSPPLRPQESLQVEGLVASEHEVDGTSEPVSQDRHRLALTVLAFDPGEQLLAFRTLRQEQHGRF
jgi:hypothetical protein